MSRSMTGFGRGEAAGGGVKFTVELKSVNHRFAEVVLRMPKQLFLLEKDANAWSLRKWPGKGGRLHFHGGAGGKNYHG